MLVELNFAPLFSMTNQSKNSKVGINLKNHESTWNKKECSEQCCNSYD